MLLRRQFPVACSLLAVCLLTTPTVWSASARQGPVVEVRGIVVDGDTGRPIADALVALAHPGVEGSVGQLTDSDGRFAFRGVGLGVVGIRASKAGYFGGYVGQRAPWEIPSRLEVVPTPDGVQEVGLRLWKPGVVAGTVVDAEGEAVVGARVVALAESLGVSGHRWAVEKAEATDDRGRYRLSGLQPAEYLIAVVADHTLRQDGATDVEELVPTTVYYPGVADSVDALRVPVRSGLDVAGIDLVVRSTPVGQLSVEVTGAAGTVDVQVVPAGSGARPTDLDVRWPTSVAGDHFVFDGVPYGDYLVRAVTLDGDRPGRSRYAAGRVTTFRSRSSREAAPLAPTSSESTAWATGVATVGPSRSHVTLTLALTEGVRVGGTVAFPDSADTPSPEVLLSTGVYLLPQEEVQVRSLRPARIETDLSFETAGLPPGQYEPVLVPPLDGWALESVVVNGTPNATRALVVGATDLADVVLKFSRNTAAVSGTVRQVSDPVDASVVLFPQDSAALERAVSLMSALRHVRASSAGRYRLERIVPGRYYIAATNEVLAPMAIDTEFLRTLVATAQTVAIEVGAELVVDLGVPGGSR